MANSVKNNRIGVKFASSSAKVGRKVLDVVLELKPHLGDISGEKGGQKLINKTPRPYLSWSQLSLWERDPEIYRQVYVDGLSEENAGRALGSVMSESLEQGEGIDDPIIQQGLLLFPRLKKREFEIKTKCNICPLLGKIDAFDPRAKVFREYKTGKTGWTQNKVNQSGQVTFYWYLVWLKYKKMPPIAWLDWLNTDPESKDYGRVRSFATVRSMTDLIKLHGRIKKAWEGINQMMKNVSIK